MLPADAPLHDAMGHPYQGHHGWLQGWLQRRLGCVEDAADLAQGTFARLPASRRVLGAREPRTYLTIVAKRLTIGWFQRQSLECAYLDTLANLPEDLASSPEQRLMVLETLHEADTLLGSLPDRVRQAFLLAQIGGLKYGAIVERLGVPLGSVKHYMQQASRRCLELME